MRKLPLLLLLLGAACTSDNITAEQACKDYSAALCAKEQTCAQVVLAGTYGDVASCTARLQIDCLSSLSAPGSTATPAKRESCAQAIAGTTCDVLYTRDVPAACVVIPGPLQAGMACGADAQCQSTYCRKPTGLTCGICGPKGAAGDACVRDDDCQVQMKCTQAKCAPIVAAGAACDATHACLPPSQCAAGTCVQVGVAGATCDATHPCDTLQSLYCPQTTKICTAVTYATAGAACGTVSPGVAVGCAGGSQCIANTGGGMVCSAIAADGTSCDAAKGPTCAAPAACVSGVCKLPNAASCQ